MPELSTQAKCSSNKYSVGEKLALVTGAGRGIGKAIALQLVRNGTNVILLGRNETNLLEVQQEIEKINNNLSCKLIVCDLQNIDSLVKKMEEVFAGNSGPDILVNSAGIFSIDTSIDTSNQRSKNIWDKTLAINLTAAYELSCYVSKFMIQKNWGRIINISSISAEGEKYALSYSAAKAGLIGLTKALSLELSKFGITVNAICPGWVETDMTLAQLKDTDWCKLNKINPEHSIEIARLSSPQERFLQADEIAHLAVFLSSLEAKGITGQSINICGGLSLA